MVGPIGDKVTKFDLRLVKPNMNALPTAALHTLEHLLATYLRQHLDGLIDLSPMGCRTGFYLTMWGDIASECVREALMQSLRQVIVSLVGQNPCGFDYARIGFLTKRKSFFTSSECLNSTRRGTPRRAQRYAE